MQKDFKTQLNVNFNVRNTSFPGTTCSRKSNLIKVGKGSGTLSKLKQISDVTIMKVTSTVTSDLH